MENTLVFLMYCGIFHETIKQEALITDKDWKIAIVITEIYSYRQTP